MKYTTEVAINRSRDKVIARFDSTDNMFKWQEGLKSVEPIEGERGREGSRTRLVYEGRRGTLTMTETVTKRDFPERFHAVYETRGVYNEVHNRFTEPEENTTLWRSVNVFRFRGLMALMAPFMKSAFTKNTLLNMERFKYFAEET